MSRKILFSDFDGTLFINGKVSEADRDAIRRWRAAGNLFVMASGRNFSSLKEPMARENVDWDFLLCLNGAEAFDADGERLFEVPIDIRLLPELYHTIVLDDGWVNVCYGDRGERVCTPNSSYYNADQGHFLEDRLSAFTRFTQICTASYGIEGAFEIKNRVLEKFNEYVSAEVNGSCVDINAKGVNKASGIARLIEIMGIPEEDVYAVGDNFNDLSMLTAYRGYAMENGPVEVQRRTGATTKSIAALIEDILSKEPAPAFYGKLVRDRIPEIICSEGFTPSVRVLDDIEYIAELYRKLREETEEYLRDQNIEEIADILEVLEAICEAKGFSVDDVQKFKAAKREKRGGFDQKLYLISKK